MAVETNTNGASVDTPPPPPTETETPAAENAGPISEHTSPENDTSAADAETTPHAIDTSVSPAERSVEYHKTLRIIGIETREIRCPLTPDGEHNALIEARDLTHEIERRTKELKDYASDEREEIKGLESKRKEILDEATKGRMIPVQCEVRAEESTGKRIIIRLDTGEKIAEEPLRERDKQVGLPFGIEGAGAADEPAGFALYSRRDREIFRQALEASEDGVGPAEKAFIRLHESGVLDPRDEDLAEQRRDLPLVTDLSTDDWIASARLQLDDAERELISAIGSDEDPGIVGRILAGEFAGIGDKPQASAIDSCVVEIRKQRAILDVADELARAEAATEVEPKPAPPSRDRKPVPEGPGSDRGLAVYRHLHRTGRLDPSEMQVEVAAELIRGTIDAGTTAEELVNKNLEALDEAEEALLAELRKPKMRKVHEELEQTGSTRRVSVSTAMQTVRERRAFYDVLATVEARLEIAEAQAESEVAVEVVDEPEPAELAALGSDSIPDGINAGDYDRLRRAIAGGTRDVFDEGGNLVTIITAASVALAARSLGSEEQ